MFDKNYWQNKKNSLLQRRQVLFQKYLDSAFEFTGAVVEINKELKEIGVWEKENAKAEPEKQEVPKPEEEIKK